MDNTKLNMVCGWCKKIKADDVKWQTVEEFLASAGLGDSTHGMCPDCSEKIFQKRVYLESYQNICKVISSSLSLDEVLNLIVTNVVKVMNVKACLLRLINKKSRTLDVAAHFGLSDEYVNKGSVGIDKSVEDALSGKSVSVYDITLDAHSKYHKVAVQEGIRSIVSIPLKFKDEIIGVLRMYISEPRDYTEEDLKFVSAIAEQAAIAIMNAKAFETIVSQEKRYLSLFQEISRTVSSSLNLGEVLDMIVRKIPEAMQVKAATIKLVDDKSKKIKMAASFGLSDNFLAKDPVTEGINISEALSHIYQQTSSLPFLKEKDMHLLDGLSYIPETIYDATTDPRILNRKDMIDEGIKSILTVPIIVRHKLIGVLKLFSGWYRNFTQQEIDFSASLAAQCGIAIENARMYEQRYVELTYLKTLQETTKLLSKTTDFHEVLQLIVRKLPEIMHTKAATIRLINPDTRQLELMASSGLSRDYLDRGSVAFEASVQLALSGKPVAIYDATNDQRIIYNKEAAKEGIKSILVVPMMLYDEIIGVLRLLTEQHRAFTQDEIDFAMALAEEAAVAIEKTRFHNKAAAMR
ncbi:MAG: GAF domain-containing protein [Candidatus Magnetobacterium sp. LHC-1]|uniref:GAF domain-containing protein n=1 Tax=Candidatus Magnetobacterium casense TaxID=1455061 RepID=A0ABS6RZ43_9BACT|nr:GAF domain-containing protein [Candidatus Magnetobacterium casensis]MBF0608549.1 GAF domain-containing protein [Nitrospirota bacterium]MBV6341620.1 GAF domain-containing protein [Candidatus Magnetobacterium casensis]